MNGEGFAYFRWWALTNPDSWLNPQHHGYDNCWVCTDAWEQLQGRRP